MTDLRISPDLALPLDAVTQTIAILARRGAGKTYTASVLVEEVVGAHQPVVVLDPTGAWWGLRSSADGQHPGLPVIILGGEHGDVPLESTAGALIADLVVDHPGAYVVDLSGFGTKAEEQRFAAAFLERLYRAKGAHREPLLLVVDEADTFAPQRPGPEQTRTLGALESIVRRGRIRGLGAVLITQRAAVLNKNVLTQTEVLVAMQTTGPQDIAAVKEWVMGHATVKEAEEFAKSLPPMERGEAWVWSPSWLRKLVRVHIRPRATFDSSKTPEAGARAIAPRAFADVDLAALGDRIRATAEQAKANDPTELRRRIRELEGLVKQHEQNDVATIEVERVVEVPVLNGQVGELRDVVDRLTLVATSIGDFGRDIGGIATAVVSALDRVADSRPAQQSRPIPGRAGVTAGRTAASPHGEAGAMGAPASPTSLEPGEARRLDAGARRMLVALARLHPTPLLRSQLGTLADVAWTSGTFRGYLSALRVAGLIEEPDKNTVALSPEGVAMMAGELGTGAPPVEDLVAMWNRKLDAGARRMLRVLVDIYPDGITRAELGERVEIAPTSGTFRGYLSKLRVNRLLDESTGVVRAGEALFLGRDGR